MNPLTLFVGSAHFGNLGTDNRAEGFLLLCKRPSPVHVYHAVVSTLPIRLWRPVYQRVAFCPSCGSCISSTVYISADMLPFTVHILQFEYRSKHSRNYRTRHLLNMYVVGAQPCGSCSMRACILLEMCEQVGSFLSTHWDGHAVFIMHS